MSGIGRTGYVDPFSRWDAMQAVELKSNKSEVSKQALMDDADDQIVVNMRNARLAVETANEQPTLSKDTIIRRSASNGMPLSN